MTKEEKKEYNKEYNKRYRENPENNQIRKLYRLKPDIKEKQRLYSKSNKDSLIYTITNPIGQVYVGATKMLPYIRWSNHKSSFKNKPYSYPLLHQSFEKWGVDTHLFKVIENHGDINRKELLEIESNMIKNLSSNGMCLNVRKV